jgi:hypothetical protein
MLKSCLDVLSVLTGAYIVYLFLMVRGLNGGYKDQYARLLLEESITLRLWLEHLGLQLLPASTLSDNLNAVSNQTRALIHQVQLRSIIQQPGIRFTSKALSRVLARKIPFREVSIHTHII